MEQPMRRDVGCQWEEPAGDQPISSREVGCQSGGGRATRDVAVQVDLMNNTDVSIQCVVVKPQKRKRGRPRKYPSVCSSLPPSPLEEEEEEEGGGREEEEMRRGGEDDSDPTWNPVEVKRHRVIGRRVVRSYRRYIKVEEGAGPEQEEEEPEQEGEEPEQDEETGNRKRKRRGRRREEEEEPDDQDQDEGAEGQQKGSVVCEICGKVMSCRTNLARHAITHTGLQPFPCSVCGQRFNRYSNAQSHMRRMHSEAAESRSRRREQQGDNSAPSWLCEMCGKSFNCHSRLRVHVMGHNGIKPYACHMCPKTYVSAADLHKHIRKIHDEGTATSVRYGGGPLLCDRCGREFKCRSLLVAHYRTHTGERPFHCDMCTLKFARPHLLRRHKANIHAEGRRVRSEVNLEEERPFVCQVCGKRVKTLLQLESHVKVHTDERPHSCSVCLRGFSSARTLRTHQLTVHAEGAERRTPARKSSAARKAEKEEPETPSPYVCPTCGRDFKFRSTLALHSVTHTKERPHACDLCPQRFGLLGHLKRHREDVHPDGKAGPKEPRTFSCPICGKAFRKSRLRMERHMSSVHGQGPAPSSFLPLNHAPTLTAKPTNHSADDNGEGTILMVTVPGSENQDGPEEEVIQRDASTPANDDNNTHAMISLTGDNDPHNAIMLPVTPLNGDSAAQHALTQCDDAQTTAVPVSPSEVAPPDAHGAHHVIAVTTRPDGGGYARMIRVARPDAGYATVMAAEGEYAQIIEATVTQPDMMEVTPLTEVMTQTQISQVDLTQPDVLVTQADDVMQVDLNQADVMHVELTQHQMTQVLTTQHDVTEVEVTQAESYDQDSVIEEVTQPDTEAYGPETAMEEMTPQHNAVSDNAEAEQVFVPLPT